MGAHQGLGARFWNRSPDGLDASFLDEHDHARTARTKPRPAATITERENAESNARWARARLQEKLRGPVTLGETLSLGLGAAAFAAFISQEQSRRHDGDTFVAPEPTRQASVLTGGDASAATPIHSAAEWSWDSRAAEPDTAEAGVRKAVRGTTITPTTFLRPGTEAEAANAQAAAPALGPLLNRGQEAGAAGRSVSAIDAGVGIATIPGITATAMADADFAASAVFLERAIVQASQAKANPPESASAKAQQGPADGAAQATAAPATVALAEARPAEVVAGIAPGPTETVMAAAKPAAASPAIVRDVVTAPPANIILDEARTADASGNAKATQDHAAASTIPAPKEKGSAARDNAAEETASRGKPDQGQDHEVAAQAKAPAPVAFEAPKVHGASTDAIVAEVSAALVKPGLGQPGIPARDTQGAVQEFSGPTKPAIPAVSVANGRDGQAGDKGAAGKPTDSIAPAPEEMAGKPKSDVAAVKTGLEKGGDAASTLTEAGPGKLLPLTELAEATGLKPVTVKAAGESTTATEVAGSKLGPLLDFGASGVKPAVELADVGAGKQLGTVAATAGDAKAGMPGASGENATTTVEKNPGQAKIPDGAGPLAVAGTTAEPEAKGLAVKSEPGPLTTSGNRTKDVDTMLASGPKTDLPDPGGKGSAKLQDSPQDRGKDAVADPASGMKEARKEPAQDVPDLAKILDEVAQSGSAMAPGTDKSVLSGNAFLVLPADDAGFHWPAVTGPAMDAGFADDVVLAGSLNGTDLSLF